MDIQNARLLIELEPPSLDRIQQETQQNSYLDNSDGYSNEFSDEYTHMDEGQGEHSEIPVEELRPPRRGSYGKVGNDVRALIMNNHIKGRSVKEICQMVNLKYSTVYAIIRRGRQTILPRGGSNRRSSINEEHLQFFHDALHKDCTRSLKELCLLGNNQFPGRTFTNSTLSRALIGKILLRLNGCIGCMDHLWKNYQRND